MTCVFQRGGPKCTKPASDQCQNWGVGEGFCDDHIARVRSRLLGHRLGFGNKIDQAQADPFGAFVEDYIKLYALMMDTSFCRSLMTKMNSEMKSGQALRAKNGVPDERDTSAKRPDDKKYIRLSRVLEYYEGLCWFPTTHRLYTGALTSENYQQSIALGYMPKDAGAGAQHGEYSHRIQWHMVMRVVTDNFARAKHNVWNHTPLALFTKLGDVESMSKGIWGVVFDNQDGRAYDNPAKLNMDLCGNFKWRAEEAELSAAKWRANNELLAFNARRRASKRLMLAKFALGKLATYSEEQRAVLGTMEVEQNVIGLVERWKKMGTPPPSHSFRFDGPTKADVTERLARAVWEEFKLEHKPDIYVQDNTESNALLRAGDELVTPELIKARVNNSYKELNTAKYAFADNLGAYPK